MDFGLENYVSCLKATHISGNILTSAINRVAGSLPAALVKTSRFMTSAV